MSAKTRHAQSGKKAQATGTFISQRGNTPATLISQRSLARLRKRIGGLRKRRSIMRIDSITPEQAARFSEWANDWIKIGLSTEPADFDKATAAALRGYELANLKRPMIILRMSSPYGATLGGALAWAMLREMPEVRSQVRSQVGSQVWSQVGSQVGDAKYNSYNGNLYASWGAYVSYMRDVLGWTDPILDRFSIDEDLIKSCGWVWWHENILAISDRPICIHRDAQNRLHCETGPSIAYRDGWSLYHWHGVSVPAEWIEGRSTLDPRDVIKAENVEQRAAGASIVGWPKMLSSLKSKIINDSGSPDIGQLIELKLPGLKQAGRFLKAVCPRNSTICEGVPRINEIDGSPIDTALAAQAWRVGETLETYKHPPRRT
jgi:hypothetical protein